MDVMPSFKLKMNSHGYIILAVAVKYKAIPAAAHFVTCWLLNSKIINSFASHVISGQQRNRL